jgi:hypothetical protein
MNDREAEWRAYYGAPELRALLARVWDPLHVYGDRRHVSEYDDYWTPVLDALQAGASERDVADVLMIIETRSIGLPDAGRGATEAAAAIASWYLDAMARLSRSRAGGP